MTSFLVLRFILHHSIKNLNLCVLILKTIIYKPLPIGVENFEKMIESGYYYIDKTLFIKELIDKKGAVNLFTRPRRFGKTLNLSMLEYFFDITKKESSHIFKGLNIMSAGEAYTSM